MEEGMREKYESLALADLRAIAKNRGIKGTSGLKKAQLVELMLAEDEKGEVIAEPIEIEGKAYRMTCVSMGNPHAVIFIDTPVKEFPLETYGPLLHRFPFHRQGSLRNHAPRLSSPWSCDPAL